MFWKSKKTETKTETKNEYTDNGTPLQSEHLLNPTEEKITPKNLTLATYKYRLKIRNTNKEISGFLESKDLLTAENKLKKKYSFDPNSLKLVKEKEFTLEDVIMENSKISRDQSIFFKQEIGNGNKNLKIALNQETQSDTPITPLTKIKDLLLGFIHLKPSINTIVEKPLNEVKEGKYIDFGTDGFLNIDYRKIIEYEKRIKKLEEEVRDQKLTRVTGSIEQKYSLLQKRLEEMQIKIEQGDFSIDDNVRINKLKKVISEFEKRVEGLIESLHSTEQLIPTRIQRLGRKALNLLDELEESKKGNVPPHIREKVILLKQEEERKYADKIADQTRKIDKKIQYLHQVLPDLEQEKEVKKIEKLIKMLEQRFHEIRLNPLLVKYHPDIADQDLVKHFQGMEHTITMDTVNDMQNDPNFNASLDDKAKRNPRLIIKEKIAVKKVIEETIFDRIKKYGVRGTFEQWKVNFAKKGGLKGAFERMKMSMLGRKTIDILGEESTKNNIDEVMFSDQEAKMKNRFNFKISEADRLKKEEADKKIIEGTNSTGNKLTDFFNMLNDLLIDLGKVKVKEKAVFYRLLSVMVSAGIPLIKSLHELVAQQDNPKFKKVLHQMTKGIESGASLSRAMLQYPDVFDEAIIGMIKSGEVSGTLPQILQRIAENIEKSAALTAKVKGAMMYPLVLVFVLTGAVAAILIFVLPKLMPMFLGNGVELPGSTKLLIFLSDTLRLQGHFVILGIVIFVVAFKQFAKTYEGRYYINLTLLKLPIFGRLLTNMILAKFSRSLSSLTASGLSIIKALKINAESIGNEVYKVEIIDIANKVKLGHTIGEILEGNKLFPSMLVNMIKVGEESAALGDVTARLAKFYEDETDDMVKNLTTLMEPIIITSLAVVVGFIMMAVMQPILALTENVK